MTLWLVVCAMVLALVIAVPFGTVMALRHRRPSGLVLSALSQVGVAVPAFLAGILLITVFAVKAPVAARQRLDPTQRGPRAVRAPGSSCRCSPSGSSRVRSSPATCAARSSTSSARTTSARHVPRGSGPPGRCDGTVSATRPSPSSRSWRSRLATLLIGAVVVERVFVIPGLGSLLLDQVANRDLIFVQDIVMLLVLAVLLVNFVVDLLYLVIDPRLKVAT